MEDCGKNMGGCNKGPYGQKYLAGWLGRIVPGAALLNVMLVITAQFNQ
jgi:hypothetical protein